MLYAQWNYEEAVSVEREEAFEDGREAGKAIGKAIGIAEGKAAGIAEGKAAGIAEGKAAGIAEGKAAGIAEGKAVGMIEGDRQVIYNFLEHLGRIPEDIQKRIEDEQDRNTLKKWYMAAPSVKSFEEFRESMGKYDN